jgi:hypothetical protein
MIRVDAHHRVWNIARAGSAVISIIVAIQRHCHPERSEGPFVPAD